MRTSGKRDLTYLCLLLSFVVFFLPSTVASWCLHTAISGCKPHKRPFFKLHALQDRKKIIKYVANFAFVFLFIIFVLN